ncbi:3-isopropylmalate dehydratase [Chromatiales bacterium (ex Bugula neritina AB1)]|nr:3-isopropylmalate dehydratase [Chromatiales bacterium (ex Bugula neritina AB1)]
MAHAVTANRAQTLFDKLLQAHQIKQFDDGSSLVLIDRIMLHERTGTIALNNLIDDNRAVAHPSSVFCTIDHIADTTPGRPQISRMPGGEVFISAMRKQARELKLNFFDIDDPRQGIVHVIAPEQGIALPGITMVCPDSHTCTLGALGALAWGIGSTDCEHALATRTLRIKAQKQMRINLDGAKPAWLTAKDIIIHLIAQYGAAHAVGHVIEFSGPVVTAMDIEQRLTLCNMAVEFGAFTAVIAPDNKTLEYVDGRPFGAAAQHRESAQQQWLALASDPGAEFNSEITLDTSTLAPAVSWGTSPEHAIPVDTAVPPPANSNGQTDSSQTKALAYMGLTPGQFLTDLRIDVAFIGSCTNSRLSDLRRAANILQNRKVAQGVRAICIPGSTQVKQHAEAEGLDKIFKQAGFQWGESGCSMCFFAGGEGFGQQARTISSTNRNFEGRQGPQTRTHIASPETVAWSAVTGKISDVRLAGHSDG